MFLVAMILPLAGSKTPQRFIPYGLMVGAPLFNDNLVNTRKDYTYMEPTTGKPHCLFVPATHLGKSTAQTSPPPVKTIDTMSGVGGYCSLKLTVSPAS